MNIMIYFYYLYIIIGLILYISLFNTIIQFKWDIDYFKMKDSICDNKLEIETYRYNLYAFFYDIYLYSYIDTYTHNDNIYSFKYIKNNYSIKYKLFITYIAILFIILIALYIFNHIVFTPIIYIAFIIVCLIYIYVNRIIDTNFNKLSNDLIKQTNILNRYNCVYRILNAIILLNKSENISVEYTDNKLNNSKYTFEEILENNIASVENISNTSKIKQIKKNVYNNLDFLKYMNLNKSSPFYWKYFNKPYFIIPSEQINRFNISENIYFDEIYDLRNSYIDYDNINIEFSKIIELIKNNTNNTYAMLYNKLYNEYPNVNNYNIINQYYIDIYNIMTSNELLESYNKNLYDNIMNNLNNIDRFLKKQQYNSIYIYINQLIHTKLNERPQTIINVPNNDYIEYFINNRDILLNTPNEIKIDFQDIYGKINEIYKNIYLFSVFLILIYLILTHYLYKKINGYSYILYMSLFIILYFIGGYIKSTLRI